MAKSLLMCIKMQIRALLWYICAALICRNGSKRKGGEVISK